MELALLGKNASVPEDGKSVVEPVRYPSVASLCPSCQYEQDTIASTTVKRRSGQYNKDLKQLRQSAQNGCWLCKAFITAMKLWTTVDQVGRKQLESLAQAHVRYDVERFTIGGPATLPKLQIYCLKGIKNIL